MMTLSFRMIHNAFILSLLSGFVLSPIHCLKMQIFKNKNKKYSRNGTTIGNNCGKKHHDTRLIFRICDHAFDFFLVLIYSIFTLVICYISTDGIFTLYSVFGFLFSLSISVKALNSIIDKVVYITSKKREAKNMSK